MAKKEKLISLADRTTEEQREIARKGGKRSGEVRREKKLMSAIYAEYLAKEHDIKVDGEKKKVSGDAMLAQVMSKILARGDSSSVSLMREIREATEGSKSILSNPDGTPLMPQKVTFEIVDPQHETNTDIKGIPGTPPTGEV